MDNYQKRLQLKYVFFSKGAIIKLRIFSTTKIRQEDITVTYLSITTK